MSKKNLIKIIIICVLLIILICTSYVNASRFNMSYLYGNYNYCELVSKTGNSLNEVSPSYFDLYSDGNLKLNDVDTEFVKEMHSKGIKVVPFLSNHWNRELGRKALSNIEKLTTQIANAIEKHNLDGINVDIENVTEIDKENYIILVKKLREKLGKNRSISVAVAANPYNWQTGWHGSYDYTRLSQYADYLMIMAYDEHYEGGLAGPVASIEFVEKSIEYAVERVDKSKIVLGIPFFGRYWKNESTYGGYGISLTKVKSLMNKYTTNFEYDENTQSAKATITIKSTDQKPVVNGKTLAEGTYTIWYENEKSIKAKLELVNEYNLKGTGSWSLGQETADTWEYYKDKLNEFAEDKNIDDNIKTEVTLLASDWALDSIKYVKENEWMTGKTENEFYPKDELTRAEFATIIARVLNLEKYSSIFYDYCDIEGHWAEKYIKLVSICGYMNGYEDGSFKPNKSITREEVAKVMSNMKLKEELKILGVEEIKFNDIKVSDWAYNSIIKMAQYGIIKGYENGLFAPKKDISREEMAVILSRAF